MHKKFLRTSILLSAMLVSASFAANAGVVNAEIEEETQTMIRGSSKNYHEQACYPKSCQTIYDCASGCSGCSSRICR